MDTQTQTRDTRISSAMVEILISSGLGEEDYGLRNPDKRYDQTRYEELASVMNQMGFSNRAGNPKIGVTLMVASRVGEEITILRSWKRMPGGYDAMSKRVNKKIAELGDDATFDDLAGIDRKLGLPKGTSFDMGGFGDYFASMDEE
jgi:hypothetical protein